jgi:hypothetical protein
MKAVALAVTALLAVTACGQSAESIDHIHTVSVVDGTVLAGSHNGLWQLSAEDAPARIGDGAWDLMGFAVDGGEYFASGHPGPGMNLPGNVGLQVSTDGGRTWSSRSLVGEVDFHRLAVAGEHVIGIDSHSGAVLYSTDRGNSWQGAQVDGARDVMVHDDIAIIVGDRQWWLVSSTDVTPIEAPLADAVTTFASAAGLYASTRDGQLWQAEGWRGPWRSVASFEQPASWISADQSNVVALVDGSVQFASSSDHQFASLRLD